MSRTFLSMLLFGLATTSLLWGCGEDGVTASPEECPPPPLKGDPDYDAKLADTIAAKCATAAVSDMPGGDGSGGAPASGAGGASGSGG